MIDNFRLNIEDLRNSVFKIFPSNWLNDAKLRIDYRWLKILNMQIEVLKKRK